MVLYTIADDARLLGAMGVYFELEAARIFTPTKSRGSLLSIFKLIDMNDVTSSPTYVAKKLVSKHHFRSRRHRNQTIVHVKVLFQRPKSSIIISGPFYGTGSQKCRDECVHT